jgi:heterotetrameric sarcosine oxidase gamma subunit
MYFIQRHPLENLLSAQAPALAPGADHLRILPKPTIVSVLAAPEVVSTMADVSPRFCGPSECLLLADETELDRLATRLKEAGVSWVDQTHAYVVARLCGPNARTILATGIAVDLHPATFSIGQSANVLCGQVQVNLARVGEDAFELVVGRSYARFFFAAIMQAGRAFSLTAAF